MTDTGRRRRQPARHRQPPSAKAWSSGLQIRERAALIMMLVVIGVDIVTRYLLNFSFEVSDEVGGYMLVVITFLSLSVCHVNGASIRSSSCRRGCRRAGARCRLRLRPAGARLLRHLALAVHPARALVLALRRPCADLSGDAALAAAARDGDRHGGAVLLARPHLPRSRAPLPRARAMGPELQILIVTVLFLGLLTAGMAVPFAITMPAVIYLLLQGGIPALNSLGLVSWGSMNMFALTAVPLFMFMAEILSASGLSNAHLRRACEAGRAAAGRPVADQHRRLRDLRLRQRLEHRHRGLDRRRGAAAAHQPQLQPRAGGRLARGGRHARHPDSAELPDDHLRHLHGDVGAEAVHRRRRSPA